MHSKWIVGSCLLIVVSALLMGWIFPVEKGKQTFSRLIGHVNESEMEEAQISKQPPVLSGRIAKIEGHRLTVVENQENQINGYVTITKETNIFRKVQEEHVRATQKDIQVGMKVSVWQDGPMIMIYPAQLTADELVIEE